MKNIIALGASNSRKSINKQLAGWAATQSGFEYKILDLNDYEMPIFSVDREAEDGIPAKAQALKQLVKDSDGIIISFAEHNGAYSAAFKNIMDWISRIEKGIWSNKPMFLLATSPGGRGAKTALDIAVNSFPHRGGEVVGNYSLPSFNVNFDQKTGILDSNLLAEFETEIEKFKIAVRNS